MNTPQEPNPDRNPWYRWLWRVRRDLLAHEMFMVQNDVGDWLTWRDLDFDEGGGGGLRPDEAIEETKRITRDWAERLRYGDPGEVPPAPWE